MRDSRRRRPPRWWPEGESWPPRGGRRYAGPRGLIFRVVFFLVGLVILGAVLGGALAAAAGVTRLDAPWRLAGGALLLFLAFAVFGGGGRAMRRLTRPVGDIVSAAKRIEAGDYAAQVTEEGPPEMRSVARAFNSMSRRLAADDTRRRSFLADVSHELRTPLAIVRGQLEAIADGVYPPDAAHLAPILDATLTLERLVGDLNTLALADSGSLVLRKDAVDLGGLLGDVVGSFQATAALAGIDLSTPADPGVGEIELDSQRVRSVLTNLLVNALRHTPPGGAIQVGVTVAGDGVAVTVDDSGEGIPADLQPRVFERFARAPGSRGSGLGLAIARELVEAHGGVIAAEASPIGGTRIRFTFPTRASAPS